MLVKGSFFIKVSKRMGESVKMKKFAYVVTFDKEGLASETYGGKGEVEPSFSSFQAREFEPSVSKGENEYRERDTFEQKAMKATSPAELFPFQKGEFAFPLAPSFSLESFRKVQPSVHTPAFCVDMPILEANARLLAVLAKRLDCKILLAQKAFSNYRAYPLLAKYLTGTTSSGLDEALLAKKYMPQGEIHVYSPAYKRKDILELLDFAEHLIFNSWSQWLLFKPLFEERKREGRPCPSVGLRLNPQLSTGEHSMYDPCSQGSRLGIPVEEFWSGVRTHGLDGIEGLHFHTLCEQNAQPFMETWNKVKRDMHELFPRLKWLNMGGGHHLTHPSYRLDLLEALMHDVHSVFKGQVYLEPGEAIALQAGTLWTEVQDVVFNGNPAAILDMSPTCHTPDVLEMPYRPKIFHLPKQRSEEEWEDLLQRFSSTQSVLGTWTKKQYQEALNRLEVEMAKQGFATTLAQAEEEISSEKCFSYLLGGPSCLAGDVMGAYSFYLPLLPGDILFMADMAIYSMVKTNTFNGIRLPSIYFYEQTKSSSSTQVQEEGSFLLWKSFTAEETERRL